MKNSTKNNRILKYLLVIWSVSLVISIVLMAAIYGTKDLDIFIIPLIIALFIPLYFFPAFIALKKEHPSTTAIVVLNFFLGGTFLGWVISLVWALSNANKTIIICPDNDHYKIVRQF